jgi:hypothetical protein
VIRPRWHYAGNRSGAMEVSPDVVAATGSVGYPSSNQWSKPPVSGQTSL